MANHTRTRNRRKLSRDAADIQSMFTRNQIHDFTRRSGFSRRGTIPWIPSHARACASESLGSKSSSRAKQFWPGRTRCSQSTAWGGSRTLRDCKSSTLNDRVPCESAVDDMVCREHAREAVRFWTAVVERTGSSRFDVEKAREQSRNAQRVLRRKGRPVFYFHGRHWSVNY